VQTTINLLSVFLKIIIM